MRNAQDYAYRQSTDLKDRLNAAYNSGTSFSRGRKSRVTCAGSSQTRQSASVPPRLSSHSSSMGSEMSIETMNRGDKGQGAMAPLPLPPLHCSHGKDSSYDAPTKSGRVKLSPKAPQTSTMLPPSGSTTTSSRPLKFARRRAQVYGDYNSADSGRYTGDTAPRTRAPKWLWRPSSRARRRGHDTYRPRDTVPRPSAPRTSSRQTSRQEEQVRRPRGDSYRTGESAFRTGKRRIGDHDENRGRRDKSYNPRQAGPQREYHDRSRYRSQERESNIFGRRWYHK